MAKESNPVAVSPAGWRSHWASLGAAEQRRVRGFGIALFVLVLAFSVSLIQLMAYAAAKPLHSHIVLIPAVSIYLLGLRLDELPARFTSAPLAAGLVGIVGALLLVPVLDPGILGGLSGTNVPLGLASASFVCFVIALGFAFFGAPWMRAAAFPFALLFFLIPLPDPLVLRLEAASQDGSAETADWILQIAGVPFLRNGTLFLLPGISLKVEAECSGIRSSWALFITSLIAANVFLHSGWRRALLVAAVIPLGLLRNGFRIAVIGWLCVHVGPHMVDSPIHHRGGPLFFILSLVPLFLLLAWLRCGERLKGRS